MGTGIKTNGEGKRFTGHLNLRVNLRLALRMQRDRMAMDYRAGASVADLAAAYGLTPGSVRAIIWRMKAKRPKKLKPEPVRARLRYAGYDPRDTW